MVARGPVPGCQQPNGPGPSRPACCAAPVPRAAALRAPGAGGTGPGAAPGAGRAGAGSAAAYKVRCAAPPRARRLRASGSCGRAERAGRRRALGPSAAERARPPAAHKAKAFRLQLQCWLSRGRQHGAKPRVPPPPLGTGLRQRLSGPAWRGERSRRASGGAAVSARRGRRPGRLASRLGAGRG